MPTIELLAEIEALRAKNKELAEHVVFWVADSKEQWTRAERAEAELAALKKDARMLALHVDSAFIPDGKELYYAAGRILEATKEES